MNLVNKQFFLPSFKVAIVAASVTIFGTCLAGSIAINDASPENDLVYTDDSGNQTPLKVSWKEVQATAKIRSFLEKKFGAGAINYPVMIDWDSNSFKVLNKASGALETFQLPR